MITRNKVVIFSVPTWKDCNARFTTFPIKALSDQVQIRYPCCGVFAKTTCKFLAYKKLCRDIISIEHF